MTHDAAAAKVQAAARNAANDNNPTIGRPNLHHETRSGLLFVGVFVGFLALIAVASLGGWWFMKHIAHNSFAHRHAANP